MGLGFYEQETVITYNREEATMNVYTADPFLIERLRKLPAYEVVREHRNGREVVAVDFKADKKLLTLRSERVTRKLTEEQKKANIENLRRARAKENRF